MGFTRLALIYLLLAASTWMLLWVTRPYPPCKHSKRVYRAGPPEEFICVACGHRQPL